MGADPGSLPGIGHYLLTTAISLALVLALAVGFLWLMRRLMPKPRGTRTVQILESVVLEQRRALHLIKVGNRTMLLGSTDGGISLLKQFDEGEIDTEPQPDAPTRFIDLLRGHKRDGSKDS